MSSRRNKKVSGQHANTTRGSKTFVSSATLLPDAETSNDRICWRFCHVDDAGPWCFGELTMGEIGSKIAHFESMTIHELFANGEEPGKHYDVAAIPERRARERLDALGLSDMTKISRLRLSGKVRMYGFLIGHCFHIVWWDPKHEVWPSKLRNT